VTGDVKSIWLFMKCITLQLRRRVTPAVAAKCWQIAFMPGWPTQGRTPPPWTPQKFLVPEMTFTTTKIVISQFCLEPVLTRKTQVVGSPKRSVHTADLLISDIASLGTHANSTPRSAKHNFKFTITASYAVGGWSLEPRCCLRLAEAAR
jgi:hypothetical protein